MICIKSHWFDIDTVELACMFLSFSWFSLSVAVYFRSHSEGRTRSSFVRWLFLFDLILKVEQRSLAFKHPILFLMGKDISA